MNIKSMAFNDKTRFVSLVFVFVAVVFIFDTIGLFEGLNKYGYDLIFRLRGERKHDQRIVIAAIDEKTLGKLGRWPIDRSHYTPLLNYFHEAAAVGMNIILSESSKEDSQLSEVITRLKKVVLPVYIDNRLNISAPAEGFSTAISGHVHLEQDIDGFVREVFHTISHRSVVIPSFASALYNVVHAKMPLGSEIQYERLQQDTFFKIRQADNMWINYYGAPGTFQYIPVAEILEGDWPPSFFSGKIVLVGKTTSDLHEAILVPFSHHRNKMPAVEVHAHSLNNLLDDSAIHPVGQGVRWVIAILLAAASFFIFTRSSRFSNTFIGFAILLAITLISIIAFTTFNVWLMPASLYVFVGVSFLLAYFFNLQKMKELLLQAKENWEESFNTINDAICIYDERCDIIQANKTAEQIFGPPVLKFLKQKCKQQWFENGATVIGSGQKIQDDGIIEEEFHPGMNRHLEIKSLPRFDKSGYCKGIIQVVRDITEKKNSETEQRRLEEQLIQAQKMEAIGTLSGGIAHDFNNILSAVMGYTELALLSRPEKDQLTDQLNHVLKASLRAKELVGQILTFSRRTNQNIQPQAVQVGLIVKEALKLIQSTFPSTIRLHHKITGSGMSIIDPSQLHQIVMNLCTNAKHAMQKDGGILTVLLNDIEIEAESNLLKRNPDLQPGAYTRLVVQDTGQGMTPDIMKRIFEPYFTTKEQDVGTGLGLAMVHGIITNCGGTIVLESQHGEGTTFTLYFPRLDPEKSIIESEEDAAFQKLHTGSEKILFVDDEIAMTSIGRHILESRGYLVVTKNNGMEALEEFRTRPDFFDAVITDMTMPQMTGEKLACELISIRPNIPIIMCTGFSEQIDEQKAMTIGIKAFLLKPFTLNQLIKTLREVLDSEA